MPKNTIIIKKRVQTITLLKEGYSNHKVAKKLGNNINHIFIFRLKKKYKETGSVKNKKRIGRLFILTKQNERTIIWWIMSNDYITAIDVKRLLKVNEKIEVSTNTICRVLKRNGLYSRAKQKKPKSIANLS